MLLSFDFYLYTLFSLILLLLYSFFFFFFNDTATTEIYTLSLHDALPISTRFHEAWKDRQEYEADLLAPSPIARSEEHTSELQSQSNLVCRLLLEKKKKKKKKKEIAYIADTYHNT